MPFTRTKSRGKEQASFSDDKYWEPSMIRQESCSVAGLAIKRWTANNSTLSFEESQEAYDLHLLKMGKKFSKKYPTNIYKLNKVSIIYQACGSSRALLLFLKNRKFVKLTNFTLFSAHLKFSTGHSKFSQLKIRLLSIKALMHTF